MDFTTAAQLLALCEGEGLTLGEAMLRRETELTGAGREEIRARLARSLEIMEQAAAAALAAPQKTMGGLIGGEAIALDRRRAEGKAVCGKDSVVCRKGDSLFLPADSGEYALEGDLTALITRVGTI